MEKNTAWIRGPLSGVSVLTEIQVQADASSETKEFRLCLLQCLMRLCGGALRLPLVQTMPSYQGTCEL